MPDTSSSSVACTCFALRKLTRTVTRLYDQHLAAANLKTTQYSLLKWAANEPLPIAELAARMSIERTTLTRNLKPLIDAGWIELKPGTDSRQRIVTITAAGRETVKAAKKAWRQAQSELERTLGTDTVRKLHLQVDSALERLTPLLGDHTPLGAD
jgi:DNA-binding MarR family transcriptional regulator